MSAELLLVEDDETLGASLRQRLDLEGFRVIWARSAAEARKAMASFDPAIILSDIRLPDGDGESVMREHFTRFGLVPTIFMTAYADIDQAVRLVRDGALNYVTKPFDLDLLVDTLKELAARAAAADAGEGDPFGHSPAMKAVGTMLERAAATDLPILLLGETGTGKEVAARHVHRKGRGAGAPFVAVNCGALPPDLADSMLFGHERGAFTGAVGSHRGFLEEAVEGTLFLDEIADLPLALQVKLLRVLETREFRRLGGSASIDFGARLICATNRPLEAMVAQGGFREDLWFRINVVTCELPPLRQRQDDIPILLARFARDAARRNGRPAPAIEDEATRAALSHGWPGNIRELINRIDRAVALASGPSIGRSDLFPESLAVESADAGGLVSANRTLGEVREAAERDHIVRMLARAEGSTTAAAELLGVSRTTLWEKMRRYGIDGE